MVSPFLGSIWRGRALASGERHDVRQVRLPEAQVLAEQQLEVLASQRPHEPLGVDLLQPPHVGLGVLVVGIVISKLLPTAARLVVADAVAALPIVAARAYEHLVLFLATPTPCVRLRVL